MGREGVAYNCVRGEGVGNSSTGLRFFYLFPELSFLSSLSRNYLSPELSFLKFFPQNYLFPELSFPVIIFPVIIFPVVLLSGIV